MPEATVDAVLATESEDAGLDFKAAFDPDGPRGCCELVKDVVAMANSGGGHIVFTAA